MAVENEELEYTFRSRKVPEYILWKSLEPYITVPEKIKAQSNIEPLQKNLRTTNVSCLDPVLIRP